MFGSMASLVFGAALLLPVADTVPRFNVEASCRAAAKMGEGLDARLPKCLDDEQRARSQLEADWSKYSRSLREGCITTATAGGEPSYVELLECLIMEGDAAKMQKRSPGDSRL